MASVKVGVDKTTVAVNLALALTRIGRRIALLDADLDAADVPLMIGIRTPADAPDSHVSIEAH